MTGLVVDTSAVIAIILDEGESEEFSRTILEARDRWISAFSVLEATVVVATRKGPLAIPALELLLTHLGLESIPFDENQALLARDAWLKYGKGRHPAALNLGDCCSYALAHHAGFPLLAKGGDFPKTDILLVARS